MLDLISIHAYISKCDGKQNPNMELLMLMSNITLFII